MNAQVTGLVMRFGTAHAALLTTDYALRSILDGFDSPLVDQPSVVTA
jgi:hypothetical protein